MSGEPLECGQRGASASWMATHLSTAALATPKFGFFLRSGAGEDEPPKLAKISAAVGGITTAGTFPGSAATPPARSACVSLHELSSADCHRAARASSGSVDADGRLPARPLLPRSIP
eukprot:7385355-Prymnesium_polylepis.1